MRSDVDLAQVVMDTLRGDSRINWAESEVLVGIREGTVVLLGKVVRLADKRRLENDATTVKGVEGVENRLTLEPGPVWQDAEIRKHVLDALEQDPWIDHTAISISVNDGAVRLSGRVMSLLRKRLAGASAWWVPGTREVINDLKVLHPEPDDDDQITDACETALEKNPLVDESEVLVRTREGVVTLLGSVCSEGEREFAEDDCWYIQGVKDVINGLSVVPG